MLISSMMVFTSASDTSNQTKLRAQTREREKTETGRERQFSLGCTTTKTVHSRVGLKFRTHPLEKLTQLTTSTKSVCLIFFHILPGYFVAQVIQCHFELFHVQLARSVAIILVEGPYVPRSSCPGPQMGKHHMKAQIILQRYNEQAPS